MLAEGGAVRAGAVPLGKAATCGGPQDFNSHAKLCLEFYGSVGVDLAVKGDFFKVGRSPGRLCHFVEPLVEDLRLLVMSVTHRTTGLAKTGNRVLRALRDLPSRLTRLRRLVVV